jgi:hypothetical protein
MICFRNLILVITIKNLRVLLGDTFCNRSSSSLGKSCKECREYFWLVVMKNRWLSVVGEMRSANVMFAVLLPQIVNSCNFLPACNICKQASSKMSQGLFGGNPIEGR